MQIPISFKSNYSQGAKLKKDLKLRVGGTREGKSNGTFQHLVHPSSSKKTPVCRTEKVTVYDLEVI